MDSSGIKKIQLPRESGRKDQAEYRFKMVEWVIQLFKREYNYVFVKNLGNGAFGEVVEGRKPDGRSVAMKIVLKEDERPMETEMWPSFTHRNVQPLSEVITIDSAKVNVFIMPKQMVSLSEILRQKEVPNSSRPLDLGLIKRWLRDILRGIRYLHERNICHLDMKAANVLISADLSAVICDFGTIASTDSRTSRYAALDICRPPETCPSRGYRMAVEGAPFDMWTVGMLAFNMFTGNFLNICTSIVNDWSEQVYHLMFEALQDETFEVLLKVSLPSLLFDKTTLNCIKNFILMFLKVDPQERPTAKFALQHEFLESGTLNVRPDKIWTEKVPYVEIKLSVEIYDVLSDILSKAEPQIVLNSDETSEEQVILPVEEALDQECPRHVANICSVENDDLKKESAENIAYDTVETSISDIIKDKNSDSKNGSMKIDANDDLSDLENVILSADATEKLTTDGTPQVGGQNVKARDDKSGIQNEVIEEVSQAVIDPESDEKRLSDTKAKLKEKQNVLCSTDLSIKSNYISYPNTSGEKMVENELSGAETSDIKSNTGEIAHGEQELLENENTRDQRKTASRRLRGWFRKRWNGAQKCICYCKLFPDDNN